MSAQTTEQQPFDPNIKMKTPVRETAVSEFFYDATAPVRMLFKYQGRYSIEYVFNHPSDDEYMKWLRSLKIRGNDSNQQSNEAEANVEFWNLLIDTIEGEIQLPDVGDFREYVGAQEKADSLSQFLAVAIGESEADEESKVRILGKQEATVDRTTEAFSGGKIVKQKHVLHHPDTNLEFEKRYSQIQRKRIRQEPTKGLRRSPNFEFVPQDDKLGKLYDSMVISNEGFVDDVIPLRFKTTVIHSLFESSLDEKK